MSDKQTTVVTTTDSAPVQMSYGMRVRHYYQEAKASIALAIYLLILGVLLIVFAFVFATGTIKWITLVIGVLVVIGAVFALFVRPVCKRPKATATTFYDPITGDQVSVTDFKARYPTTITPEIEGMVAVQT